VAVEGMVGAGLITLEKVQAIFYKAKSQTDKRTTSG
jgi:hypothetical protein